MTEGEYKARRREIIERRNEEIWDHEDAGCPGDAEIARKWMRFELAELDREYAAGGKGEDLSVGMRVRHLSGKHEGLVARIHDDGTVSVVENDGSVARLSPDRLALAGDDPWALADLAEAFDREVGRQARIWRGVLSRAELAEVILNDWLRTGEMDLGLVDRFKQMVSGRDYVLISEGLDAIDPIGSTAKMLEALGAVPGDLASGGMAAFAEECEMATEVNELHGEAGARDGRREER